MGKELFGTDGIRGVAGEYPLDPPTVHALGMALGSDVRGVTSDPEVLIGMDTRESSPWIAAQVAGGLARRGVRVRNAGVITTPGVAYLTSTGPFCAGVMISASHNPYRDNGIKVFSHSGFKLPDEEEHIIEQEIFRLLEEGVDPKPAALQADVGLDQQYLEFLISTAPALLTGYRIVLDCGNGGACQLAYDLFSRLGATITAINRKPDGRNINLNCGAMHVEGLRQAVLDSKADFGAAFDGDADRAIFVSGSGKVVNGDGVLLVAGRDMRASGRLPGDVVVATVMSNLGLEKALQRHGIRMLRTPVGDKYVLEEMVRCGAMLGGEQSGHVIFREYATTGDGLLTALRVFEIAVRDGRNLDELTAEFAVFPQRLVNVRVRERRPLEDIPAIAAAIRHCEQTFGDAGRVVVRYSGTEPLARVMVEGPDLAQVEDCTARIAGAIEQELGTQKGV
ncbi:MAG TPA: phosphoglucosamine mutase [Bryobacteraceae bacterium]|nr:phosphoglucosamine mutase [Bryobacteraceae bacterium]